MVEVLDARGAKGVATVDQDARDSLSHVVLAAAKLADIQLPRVIVQV
jgi:hypothetical protein